MPTYVRRNRDAKWHVATTATFVGSRYTRCGRVLAQPFEKVDARLPGPETGSVCEKCRA
jgi:hypothetical protein